MSDSIEADRSETSRDIHAPTLRQSAAALWGDGFWGRDQPNPENTPRRVKDEEG